MLHLILNDRDHTDAKTQDARGAAKRFKKTGTGKIVRASAFKRHILTSKETKIEAPQARHEGVRVAGDAKKLKLMLPYD
jgi:large subunit ribosomal protein L35